MALILLVCAISWVPGSGEVLPQEGKTVVWQDAVSFQSPDDPIAKDHLTRAATWLKRHTVTVSSADDGFAVPVIAWKDPTLEPENPRLLAGYLITDTLWAAKALKAIDPSASQDLERGIQRLGWYGNGLQDVLFHPIGTIKHRPADQDRVHGFSLGRFPISDDRVVDLRAFHQKEDAAFTVGHPSLFAEHAVYQALHEFWQGRRDQARRRILDALTDDRDRDPKDRIFWDDRDGILVDFVNYEEWAAFRRGDRPSCRHFTFKLGVLLYAIRLLGLEPEVGARLEGMKRRLWDAQWEDGGVAHFVEVGRAGGTTRGRGATGEATAIAILSETVVRDQTKTGRVDPVRPAGPFGQRGYYITFMRMPTYDLDDWKSIIDGIHTDGGNTLILWVAGGFRSSKYPITWRYNAEHHNVRHDFVRGLIDHAHTKGIAVLLGFTPFGYDGVNQYTLEHPELRAIGKDGKRVAPFGIGCWGYNLCPSQPESQRFMLEYAREMAFDFYPEADGLLIESSDYAICHCEGCGERYFKKEFEFVRQISDEVWARKPEATIVVFPHYFSGADVPGFGVKAARLPFDPRWSLVFSPHSAHPEPDLIQKAKASLWWDDAPALRDPRAIRAGALRAREIGATGYIPSLEAFTFVANEAEEGQPWLKGRRQVPLGFGWLAPGEPPYDELPMRVQRIAYREFSRNPDLSFEAYRAILGRDLFGAAPSPQAIDDALELQSIFNTGRTWCQPSPPTSPDRVRAIQDRGELTTTKQAEYRAALDRLRVIEARHRVPGSNAGRELHRIARWVLDQWAEGGRRLLEGE